MKVITAPETVGIHPIPTVFLAGGITNCPEWQDDIIKLLEDHNHAVLLNPRRKDFPIGDPNAARGQITWEYQALERSTVFSMWFCNASSDQPICMYELGRHLGTRRGLLDGVVIGIEPGYRREQDVRIQTELVNPTVAERITDNLEDHSQHILRAIERITQ